MGVHACAYRGQNPLQLELTPIVRHLMWVLGMEPTLPKSSKCFTAESPLKAQVVLTEGPSSNRATGGKQKHLSAALVFTLLL